MSLCKHHINVNSTFSWWRAWLLTYDHKEVIVPRNFISNIQTKDIYPNHWIKINY